MGGRDDAEVVRLPGLQHRRPHLLGVQGGVAQVDLVALLAGEPGLGHHDREPGDLSLHQPVGGQAGDLGTEQVGHQVDRPGALHLDRRHVDLVDLDVEGLTDLHPLQPQHQIGIRQAEPELVLGDPQQHGIVEDPALLVAEDDVAGAHHRDLRRVPGDHQVDERLGVGALHPDLALDRDVPQRDVVDQRVVLGHGPAVLGPDVAAGVVDAVVDLGPPAPGRHRQVPVRRFADPGRDQHLHGGRAGLPEVYRDDPVGLVDRGLVVIGQGTGTVRH